MFYEPGNGERPDLLEGLPRGASGPPSDLLQPPVPALPAPLEMQGPASRVWVVETQALEDPGSRNFASLSLSFTIFTMGTNLGAVHQMRGARGNWAHQADLIGPVGSRFYGSFLWLWR